jgi:hypothetical protein
MPTDQDDRGLDAIRKAVSEAELASARDKLIRANMGQLTMQREEAVHTDPSGFVTKDSGRRDEFETGARRDVQDDKPGYDQIPVWALERLAYVYTRGAKKYGRDNWKKGISYCRMIASILRHVFAFAKGETDEDHLAQAAWNLFGLMYYQWAIDQGKLPASLDDRELPRKKVSNAANP